MRTLPLLAAVPLLSLATAGRAVAQRPVSALPVVRQWQVFTDPQEGAFTLEMPRGWKDSGGTARRNALQYRGWALALSPDGATVIAVNDPGEPSYIAPSPLLMASGFRIGRVYNGGGGTSYIVAPYESGEQYAVTWGQRALRTLCTGTQLSSHRSRPDLTQRVNGLSAAFGIVHDFGEAAFTCEKNGQPMVADIYMSTTVIRGAGIWYADVIEAFLTPKPFAGLAAGLLAHMVRSVRVNPVWLERQSQTNVDVSRIATETNAAISDTIMQGWEDRGAVMDRIMEEDSRARLGIDVYADPATGTQYTVSNTSRYYWANAGGTVVGTDTDTAPPGFTRLNRVPPR